MKRIFTFVLAIFMAAALWAQTPQSFSYQAVARNLDGEPITNQQIAVKISILSGSASGNVVYSELHQPVTNSLGLFDLQIGNPLQVLSGSFPDINWGAALYFLKLEIDAEGGSDFQFLGTSQLLSVPYALYARTAENGFSGNYNDLTNKPVTDGSETKVTAGTNVTITGTGTTENPYVVTAAGSSGGCGFTHFVGELYGGGIVFHVFKDADGTEHGLVASLSDLGTSVSWGLSGINVPNCESTWNGQTNTNAIIATGLLAPAAHLCINYTGGGFTDWYLPAIDELNLLYHSRFNVNRTLSGTPGSTEIDQTNSYWSSTEYGADLVWFWLFPYGYCHFQFYDKTNSLYVRAVRAF